MKKQITVDAELLKRIVDNFNKASPIENIDFSTVFTSVEVHRDYAQLSEALTYAFPEGGDFKVGYCVIPKPGRNYLRDGAGAHGEAVVVSLHPFTIVSLDGLHSWGEGIQDTLVVRAQMPPSAFKEVLAIWNRSLDDIVAEVNKFCKTQTPINP